MNEPTLNTEELRSPTWRKLKAHIETELTCLRILLESDVTPERTAKLRGQIRSYVLILALEIVQAPVSEEEEPE